jgi:hypothetical protein
VELHLNADWTYMGLRVVTLENSSLRVQVLPEAGAKIWQITHKTSGTELLWNNSRIPPARHAIHARYDDVSSGGWDELFPVDEESTIHGELYPDHGELWTGKWDFEPFSSSDQVGVVLRFQTPISSIAVEKKISLTDLLDDKKGKGSHGSSANDGEAEKGLRSNQPEQVHDVGQGFRQYPTRRWQRVWDVV